MSEDERRRQLIVALQLRNPAAEAATPESLTTEELEWNCTEANLIVMAEDSGAKSVIHNGEPDVYELTSVQTGLGSMQHHCYPSLKEAKRRGEDLIQSGQADRYLLYTISGEACHSTLAYDSLETAQLLAEQAEREEREREEARLEELVRRPLSSAPLGRPSALAERASVCV